MTFNVMACVCCDSRMSKAVRRRNTAMNGMQMTVRCFEWPANHDVSSSFVKLACLWRQSVVSVLCVIALQTGMPWRRRRTSGTQQRSRRRLPRRQARADRPMGRSQLRRRRGNLRQPATARQASPQSQHSIRRPRERSVLTGTSECTGDFMFACTHFMTE